MGGLFSKPKAQKPPPPAPLPPPPVYEDAEVKAEDQAAQLRRRRGRASTILNEENANPLDGASVSAAAKVLGT